jgi:hypothetical protein
MDKIFKRNELIQLVSVEKNDGLSLSARLAYNLILEKAHKFYKLEGNTDDTFEIGFNELTNFSQTTNSKFKEKLKVELLKLLSAKYFTYDKKYIKTYFTLLSQFEITKDCVKVALPPILKKEILENNYYTTLNKSEIQAFKSKYTLIMFELIKRYKNSIPKMSIEKFKNIFEYPDSYRNVDITRRVLEPIKKELFEKNKLVIDWEIFKIGAKWREIEFNIIELVETEEQKIKISDKLLNSIEKARKNRFVDNCYSQKAMNKIIEKYDEKDIIKALGELYKYNSEIKSFSKILTSKIEDIKNSKMNKIKENQGDILGQEKIETPVKSDFTEPKKSNLDIEKEKVSNLIRNSDLPTNKRMNLWSQLAEIQNLEDLEKFKNNL